VEELGFWLKKKAKQQEGKRVASFSFFVFTFILRFIEFQILFLSFKISVISILGFKLWNATLTFSPSGCSFPSSSCKLCQIDVEDVFLTLFDFSLVLNFEN